ncbi:IS6 family transposase [Acinetobacter baumannii]|nr:IS6 family transposase [Acinetobacter baumannii]
MNPFHGRHFQGEIILWAVRWYCKYGISYRELQEMLAERGVNVDHTTIYRWVQRYAPEMEKRLRWYWRNPTDLHSWHMDETYIKVKGRWTYLYRAVDQRGHTIDLALLQITTNGKLKTVLAKGAAYESFPWSAFSGRNHSLGCALVL